MSVDMSPTSYQVRSLTAEVKPQVAAANPLQTTTATAHRNVYSSEIPPNMSSAGASGASFGASAAEMAPGTLSSADWDRLDDEDQHSQAGTESSPSSSEQRARRRRNFVIGCYEIGRKLGQGNYAIVRLAKSRITKREVAIKCIDKEKMDEASLERTHREIEVLKKLNHPNIASLYQVHESNRAVYIMLQLASNGELAEYLPEGKNMPEPEARIKMWQIVSAIEYCHSLGIVHRDLKAENVLLDEKGNVKICDFGFANFYKFDDTLRTFCGSPPYAAPEVFEGKEYVGPEVDIWSMGVILFKMVCGNLPFTGGAYHDLRYRVTRTVFRVPFFLSTDCEDLLRRMLHKNPKRRAKIPQIKEHIWMVLDPDAEKAAKEKCMPAFDFEKLNEDAVQIMQQSEISREITYEQCKSNARDNIMAIYMQLCERLWSLPPPQARAAVDNATAQNPTAATATEASEETNQLPEVDKAEEAPPSSEEPEVAAPTDIEPPVSPPQQAPPGHVLVRQSTTATITSLDEGFETDVPTSSATIYNSRELQPKGSQRAASLPHESVDPIDTVAESGLMSSRSSCPQTSDGTNASSGNCLQNAGKAVRFSCPQNTSGDRAAFGENWQASDNTMCRTTQAKFSLGQHPDLGAEGNIESSASRVDEQLRNMLLDQPGPSNVGRFGMLQKRISLPENLEFQPQKLLNIKQSLHVEQKLGEASDVEEYRNAHRVRMMQLQLKNRMHPRQQASQKHGSASPKVPPTLPEEPIGSSLSPIEDEGSHESDTEHEEPMDTH